MERIDKIWAMIKNADKETRVKMLEKLSDEDIIELRYRTNPYRQPIYHPSKKYLEFSYINLQRDYERNLMMTSMVGFFYKMASEWNHVSDKYPSEEEGDFAIALNNRFKKLYVENLENYYETKKDKSPEHYGTWLRARAIVAEKKGYDFKDLEQEAIKWCSVNGVKYEAVYPIDVPPTEAQYEEARVELKKELGVKKTKQDKIRETQDKILDFLDYHLQFDPNNHIRCNYFPNYDKVLKEKVQKAPESYKTENGMLVTENFEEYLIPPKDTFHSFTNYFETNYEHLRQCTDDIYGRNQFECAIIGREVFDSEEKANAWEHTYKTDFDVAVQRTVLGEWTFIDPFKENREKIKFNDDHARLAADIIERKKEEERIGKEILQKRAKKMKGRMGDQSVPFENGLTDYNAERIGEYDMQTNVYETKLIRSRRPRTVFNFNTIVLDQGTTGASEPLPEKEELDN